MLDPERGVHRRLAAQQLFGAARLSAGVPVAGAGVVSVRRGNPRLEPMTFVSSVSKLRPVELSSPLREVGVPVADPVEDSHRSRPGSCPSGRC